MRWSLHSRSRRLAAIVAAVALIALAWPTPAAAGRPVIERFSFTVVDEPAAVCFAGTDDEFTILSSYTFNADAIVFEGTVDEPIHVLFHTFLTGTLTNSVTGASLPDRARSIHRYNAYRGTDKVAGIEYLTTIPGQGVVVADVGQLVYGLTADGQILLSASGPHDVLDGGVEVFCPYLA